MPPNRISLIPYLKLFNACIQPILLYGAEVWSMDYLFKNTTKWESTLINFLPEQIHIRDVAQMRFTSKAYHKDIEVICYMFH